MKKRLIAGIDVGTTKICAVVAEADDSAIMVRGVGTAPARGLKKGIVVNLSETIDSIKIALQQAEHQSQTVIESAFVSVGGAHIVGHNSYGETEVRGRNGEVSGEDIERAVTAAQEIEVPQNHEIIHVLTQSFKLDGQEGIVNPEGMCGQQLGVHLHVVINATAIVQNIVNAINKSGVLVDGVVMQQLASAEAVLSEDEKEMGSYVVDIGGGTADLAAFNQGSIWYSKVLPLGGGLITKDLAIGLRAPIQEAEEAKKQAGSVFPESVPSEEVVELSEVGSRHRRTVPRTEVCRIIRARCDEILQEIGHAAHAANLDRNLVTGIVLTGGGSLLDGLIDRAEQLLGLPVRLGYPVNVVDESHETFDPSFATALGLLRYAQRRLEASGSPTQRTVLAGRTSPKSERVRNWILEKIS